MQYKQNITKKTAKNCETMLSKIRKCFKNLPASTVEHCWIVLQHVMNAFITCDRNSNYCVPNIGKEKLVREGHVIKTITVIPQAKAWEWLYVWCSACRHKIQLLYCLIDSAFDHRWWLNKQDCIDNNKKQTKNEKQQMRTQSKKKQIYMMMHIYMNKLKWAGMNQWERFIPGLWPFWCIFVCVWIFLCFLCLMQYAQYYI